MLGRGGMCWRSPPRLSGNGHQRGKTQSTVGRVKADVAMSTRPAPVRAQMMFARTHHKPFCWCVGAKPTSDTPTFDRRWWTF
jgi:hypothetical protein